jgi:hypothetical protein
MESVGWLAERVVDGVEARDEREAGKQTALPAGPPLLGRCCLSLLCGSEATGVVMRRSGRARPRK